MGELIPDDLCEEILVRLLDVEDLIRWKSVCKSWKSLISHPRFVKAYHTRQVGLSPSRVGIIPNYLSKYNGPEYYMVGSSNGLACITSFDGDGIIVANPWTRQERMLQKLPGFPVRSCWGFGYDALTDDYKVVCGVGEGLEKTTFHVLSLKSNVWKHVGHVNCICFGVVQISTLCNGALHWVMYSGSPSTRGLISFDLSKEVFKKINPPDDSIHKYSFLATKEGCVSIYCKYRDDVSGLEKYIRKPYWVNKSDNYYTLRTDSENPYTFIPTTVMPSLISPYLQEGNE